MSKRLEVIASACGLVALCAVSPVASRELTFEERVKAQEAIERVYYAHLDGPLLSFEETWPTARLEAAARAVVRRSIALERQWHTPITAEMLDAELARIERDTAFPSRLREIFAALGNDPVLIEETLVRSALSTRLADSFFASDARIPKEEVEPGFDRWYATAGRTWPNSIPTAAEASSAGRVRWSPSAGPCPTDDTWDNGLLDHVPEFQARQVSAWTGSELIVYGGYDKTIKPTDFGRRYQPLTDTWAPMSRVGSPGRLDWSAGVWTGSTFVVWGGKDNSSANPPISGAGGRYNPAADSWSPIAAAGAPESRFQHTAVWSGTEMIVWGGVGAGGTLNTGARYNPSSDTWTPVSTVNAPSPRRAHVAVWTGAKMFVWGGNSSQFGNVPVGDGALYDPVSDTWTTVNPAGAPLPRHLHSATWIGNRVFVWGGIVDLGGGATDYSSTGALYNPANDTWSATATSGAPTPRSGATTVWTGSRVIVWGGFRAGYPQQGGRYDPVANTWTLVSTLNVPEGRVDQSGVWTGNLMLIWGGSHDTPRASGGRYDPLTDSWTPTSEGFQFDLQAPVNGEWNGVEAYWTEPGRPTAAYNPTTDVWRSIPWDASLGAVSYKFKVWAGVAMLFWGETAVPARSGVIFDTRTDTWRTMAPNGPLVNPSGGYGAVWTGTELIFWHADINFDPQTYGGRYVFATDTWAPHPNWNGPQGVYANQAFWTGTEAIFWGINAVNPGGAYNPLTDTWRPVSYVNTPGNLAGATNYWSGTMALAWTGRASGSRRYDLASDTWLPVSATAEPQVAGFGPARAFSGSTLAVWSARTVDSLNLIEVGGRYDVIADAWTPVSEVGSPGPRSNIKHYALAGTRLVVYGGSTANGAEVRGGGRYLLDPDRDGDGTSESCDNCPGLSNPSQSDSDSDGQGDACDPCPLDPANDGDHDAVCGNLDNCPAIPNATQQNGDGDAFGDVCDNCPTVATASQADSDADGLGDACDVCPLDVANDSDGDGRCASADNCPEVFNPAQLDTDGDGLGELCDNCRFSSNQTDTDGDGAGDSCDCQVTDPTDRSPAEATGLLVGRVGITAHLTWAAVSDADAYSVSRGDLAAKATNQYGSCIANGLPAPSFDDLAMPSPGQGFFYLVQAQNFDCGLGSLGASSTEQPRANNDPGGCDGVVVGEAHALSETTVFGTIVVGSLADTLESDNALEVLSEDLSTGGSPATRFSRLEHRWTFNVGPGTTKELHVEGHRFLPTDGDDFHFEYSTNGTSFTPVALTLPINGDADTDVDRMAVLPASLIGTLIIRVVDTDHTAGHQTLDTVTIDEIWIRSVP